MTDQSTATKHTEVLRLLRDPVHRQQSNRAIARLAGVDHKTVGKWRRGRGRHSVSFSYPDGKPGAYLLPVLLRRRHIVPETRQ